MDRTGKISGLVGDQRGLETGKNPARSPLKETEGQQDRTGGRDGGGSRNEEGVGSSGREPREGQVCWASPEEILSVSPPVPLGWQRGTCACSFPLICFKI